MSVTTTALQFPTTGLFTPDGRYFSFRAPLLIEVRFEDGIWTHSVPELQLSAYGETGEESLEALQFVLLGAWETYVLGPEPMHKDAMDARQCLLSSVELLA